jgi:hypothetical protein
LAGLWFFVRAKETVASCTAVYAFGFGVELYVGYAAFFGKGYFFGANTL